MSNVLAVDSTHGLNAHSFAIFLHILLFTYWLGGDLGVFYSSRYVIKPSISPESRATALKIMHFVDAGPRICLILMLPSGVTLMALDEFGRDIFLGWPLVLIWIAGLAWLAIAMMDYNRRPERFQTLVNKADWTIRLSIVVVLIGIAAYTLIATEPFGVDTNPKWLGGKLLAYSLCILCGVMIRLSLRGFGPAWVALQRSGSTPAVERALSASMRRALPWVYSIWTLVVIAALLGIIKPGTTAY